MPKPSGMPETCAQRTLVKSPPELWSEISDAQTLARRLSAFGEVRITRMEPETAVAWEGAFVRGKVELEASGWGTKVTITATTLASDDAQLQDTVAFTAMPEPTPEPEPEPATTTSPRPEATGTDIPPQDTARAPREGFLARLTGWWHTGRWAPLPAEPPAPAAAPAAPEPAERDQTPPVAIAAPEVEPVVHAAPEPAPEPVPTGPAADELEGLLVAVLDDLGSAHHRPFSRA